MKKFTYVIAAALAFTCAVTAIPEIPTNVTETSAVYIAPNPHSIPTSGLQANYFYNEIGEISYCKCGEIITCIPIANPDCGLHVTYKLNGEEFTPENVVRNYMDSGLICCDALDDTSVIETSQENKGHTGYESISFFPKETDKDYTLEIKVEFSSAVTNTTDDDVDPIVIEDNYKFEFKVDKDGIIIPGDACITPSTYQQSEIFKRKYGNYTACENKVIVCTPCYWDGGYDVEYESNAELLSEKELYSPAYYVDPDTGVVDYICGSSGNKNKALTFDASKEGTYSVKVYNKREWEEEKVDTIEFTYHVDKNGNIGFPQVSKLTVPTDYFAAEDFIQQYGESETDGFQVIEVIPVVKSDNFSMNTSTETTEDKPYVKNTATYYCPNAASENCKGYQVTTYTMNRSLSSDEINIEKLYHITNTEYKADENYTIRKAYFCGYLIDKETKSFKEYLTEPASFAESEVFLRKYGNFCADPNQQKVIAVIPEHYELSHEIGGTAELLKTKYYDDDEAEYIDDNGQVVQTCDLGGNKILMFDASKAGTYTIRIKETWAGWTGNSDNAAYYNIDYSVDGSGNITLSKPSENPEIPETISSFEDADKVFKSNGGYIINQGETLQIAVPVNFSVEKPGGGMAYEEYDTTYTGTDFPNRLETIEEKLYVNENSSSDELGYRVYTYDLSPKEIEILTTDGNFAWVTSKLEGDFSITYRTSEDFNPYGDNNFYTFRFNAENDTVTNTGVLSKDSGDADGSGQIDIADVVVMSAFIGSPEKNNVSDTAKIYCDIHNHGDGITANDALMLQQYLANIITGF